MKIDIHSTDHQKFREIVFGGYTIKNYEEAQKFVRDLTENPEVKENGLYNTIRNPKDKKIQSVLLFIILKLMITFLVYKINKFRKNTQRSYYENKFYRP